MIALLESTVFTKCLPYMAKLLSGKTFAVFAVFHSFANVFLQIMALLIGIVSLQAC